MGSNATEAKITIRLTPGQARSFKAMAKKYKTNQTKLLVAMMDMAKEFPHQLETRV